MYERTVTLEIPDLAARNIRSLISERFREELRVLQKLEDEGADRDHIARVTMDDRTEQAYKAALAAIDEACPE